MKLALIIKNPQPTQEMIDNFLERTNRHIGLVAKNLGYFIEYYENREEPEDKMMWALVKRRSTHDASKFQEPEYTPYLWITEFHRCKQLNIPFSYPPGIEITTKIATEHHVMHNSHHPEFHGDINTMPLVDIIELVCDWAGMAEELHQGTSARPWAEKTIGTKWHFDKLTSNLIFKNIDLLDHLKS